MSERLRLARIAGEQARRYLVLLRAVEEYPQNEKEEAWNRLATTTFQLAGALGAVCFQRKYGRDNTMAIDAKGFLPGGEDRTQWFLALLKK